MHLGIDWVVCQRHNCHHAHETCQGTAMELLSHLIISATHKALTHYNACVQTLCILLQIIRHIPLVEIGQCIKGLSTPL